jgi:hypothetical protein
LAIEFNTNKLILCEGSSDKAFFNELIRVRNVPDIQVHFPLGADEKTGGIDKFGRFLNAIIAEPTFNTLSSILIVADNDSNHANNFLRVINQIRDAGYGVPNNELQFFISPNSLPSIAVMMLPLNQRLGSLESVCLESALSHWNTLNQPLETYFNASQAPNWSIGHQDKMKIQCLIAATCETNPYATISTLFRENQRYHFPLTHTCFDGIANFLLDWDTHLTNAV